MKMHEDKIRRSGSSDARSRQGGDIVPVPPRSGRSKSSDGLPAVLLARTAGEMAIAKEIARRRKGRRGEESSPPLRIRGGGDSDQEEQTPFAGFEIPSLEEWGNINDRARKMDIRKMAQIMYGEMEERMAVYLDPNRRRKDKERHGRVMANTVKEVIKVLVDRITDRDNAKKSLEEKIRKAEKELEEEKRKVERLEESNRILQNQISDSSGKGNTKDEVTQTEEETFQSMDTDNINRRDEAIQTEEESDQLMDTDNVEIEEVDGAQVISKLEEILTRIKALEDKGKEKEGTRENIEREDTTTWSEAAGRKKKEQKIQESRDKDGRREVNANEERRDKSKERTISLERRKREVRTSLQAMSRRVPRGAGVLLELRGGTLKEYQEVLKNCQDKINLEELGIPPVGLRRARGGGILLEIKCKEGEEEKAKLLAERIKEVVGSVEGATVAPFADSDLS